MKLYKDVAEAQKHQRAIDSLASEAHTSVDEVRTVYETELQKIKEQARVPDFVPTLAHRRARQALKHRRR